MLNKNFLIIIVALFVYFDNYAQRIATLEVELSAASANLQIPVQTNLDALTNLPDSALVLKYVNWNTLQDIPFQIEHGDHRILHWYIKPDQVRAGKVRFQLIQEKNKGMKPNISSSEADGILTIQANDRKLLGYYFKTLYPPEGVDTAYKRSGFVHPLYAPNGQELTRIQPPDHYHHYGIWNPWTHVLYKGDTVDFWNLAKRQATVRFAKFVQKLDGPVFSQYDALHEHVVFTENGEEVAMNEVQSVRIYYPEDQNFHIVDFTMKMNCAQDAPVTLLEYRYEGFGWRTTEKWDKNNSEVISSTGKDRKTVDGSKERWAIIQGELDEDYGGVVMMSHPTNYNHPEPMRVWPENQYNRGDMFASFSTTKDVDWVLEPKKNYVLKYRLIVFNDRFDPDRAENGWKHFASIPKINIITN